MTAPHLGPGHSIAGKYTVRALLGFTGEVATYHAVSNDGREMVVKLYDPSVGQRADVMAQLDRVRQQIAQHNLPAWRHKVDQHSAQTLQPLADRAFDLAGGGVWLRPSVGHTTWHP